MQARCAVTVVALGLVAASVRISMAASVEPRTAATSELRPETDNYADLYRPETDLERRLMSELACTCGGCELEPIDECKCPFAARMRQQVKQRLAAYDLSNDDARSAAYDHVRSSFVDEFGRQVLRKQPEPALGGSLVPIAATAAALVVLLAVVLFILRRRGHREPA